MVVGLDRATWGMLPALMISIGLLTFGSVRAAAATFDEREFTCPIGGQKFKATIMLSTSIWGPRLDLKPLVPFWLLPVCSENGFVMYKDDFSDAELAKLTPIVLSTEYQERRAENTSYFMVAYMHERMGGDDAAIARFYLTASWEAETERPALVSRYRNLALQNLEVVLGGGQRWEVVLLAAELERLLGHFDAARARLAAVPSGVLDETQSKVLEQIRNHAQNRNSEPQLFTAK